MTKKGRDMIEEQKTPWHLWAVGLVSLLWNAMGGVDYTMTHLRDPGWMAQFTPEQIAYFDGFPIWATGFWAIGVWGAIAGSILLLFRRRWAVAAFGLSLLGLIGGHVYRFGSKIPDGWNTGPNAAFAAILAAVAVFLLWYAVRMQKHGWLK